MLQSQNAAVNLMFCNAIKVETVERIKNEKMWNLTMKIFNFVENF